MKIFGGDLFATEESLCLYCQAPTENTCHNCGGLYCQECLMPSYEHCSHLSLDDIYTELKKSDPMFDVNAFVCLGIRYPVRSWPSVRGLNMNRLYERRFEVLQSLFRCGLKPNTITVFTFASSFILSVSGTLKDPTQRSRFASLAAHRLIWLSANIFLSKPHENFWPLVVCVASTCRGIRKRSHAIILDSIIIRQGTKFEKQITVEGRSHDVPLTATEDGFLDPDFDAAVETSLFGADLFSVSRETLADRGCEKIKRVEKDPKNCVFYTRRV